jgi:hypothetical protein
MNHWTIRSLRVADDPTPDVSAGPGDAQRWDDVGADALGQPAHLLVAQPGLTSDGLAGVPPGSKQLLGPLQPSAAKALSPDVLLRQRPCLPSRLSQGKPLLQHAVVAEHAAVLVVAAHTRSPGESRR